MITLPKSISMSAKSLLYGAGLLALLVTNILVIQLVFTPQRVSADATSACAYDYLDPADSGKFTNACRDGWYNGKGDQSVCSKYSDSDLRGACTNGYNEYKRASAKCNGDTQCIDGLRSNNSATASSVGRCETTYGSGYANSRQERVAACKDGYQNGKGDGTVCIKYRSNPDTAVEAACRAGWDFFQNDRSACVAAGKTEAECTQAIRSGSNGGGGGGNTPAAPAGTTADPSVNRNVGHYPTTGDISSLITYKFKCEEADRSKCVAKACNGPGAGEDSQIAKARCDRAGRQCVPNADTGGSCDASSSNKCALEGFFGTMICGVVQMMGSMTDTSYDLLSLLLKTDPVLQTTQGGSGDSSMYAAWSVLRNLGNVFFVITFLIVILSYTSNIGISAYNIRKILPRLIMAAFLINASWWICAIFVDLSNIIGATITDTLGGITSISNNNSLSDWKLVINSVLFASAAVIAASSLVIYGGFSVLLPALISALIAVVTVFILLLARQVLIIIFIIISPLAFAAILLPGTNFLFERWRKMFVPLLMLYPVIGLIFGLSKVASDVVIGAAADRDQSLLAILGLAIQIIPLFLLPKIMKLGGSALGAFDRVSDSKFAKDKRKQAEDYHKHKQKQRELAAVSGGDPKPWQLRKRALRAKFDREEKRKSIDENLDTAQNASFRRDLGIDKQSEETPAGDGTDEEPTTNTAGDDETPDNGSTAGDPDQQDTAEDENDEGYNDDLARKLAQTDNPQAIADARNFFIKKKVDAVAKLAEAKRLELRNSGVGRDAMLDRAINATNADGSKAHSELVQDAAVLHIAQSGDLGAILALMKNSGNLSFQQRRVLMRGIADSGMGNKVPFLGDPETQDKFIRGEINGDNFHSEVVAKSMAENDWSADTYARLDKDAMVEVDKVRQKVASGEITSLSPEKMQEHGQAAYDALHTKETKQAISRNEPYLESLTSWRNSP